MRQRVERVSKGRVGLPTPFEVKMYTIHCIAPFSKKDKNRKEKKEQKNKKDREKHGG